MHRRSLLTVPPAFPFPQHFIHPLFFTPRLFLENICRFIEETGVPTYTVLSAYEILAGGKRAGKARFVYMADLGAVSSSG